MINLNQLRAFYYVAKHASFTIAAEKLFISPPAVTAQIKLFEKAEIIFGMEGEVEAILTQMKELNHGLLKIGCTKAYAKHIMPSIISVFRRAYPNIKIILEEGSSMAMINNLRDFKNEVVVVAQMDVNDSRIQFIPFSYSKAKY